MSNHFKYLVTLLLVPGVLITSCSTNKISKYDEEIRGNPNNAEAYFERGYEYSKLKQYQKAIDDYRKASSLDPHYTLDDVLLQLCYDQMGNYPKAIQDYTKDIERNPKNAEAYCMRSRYYSLAGQHHKAIDDCSKAMSLKLTRGTLDALYARRAWYHYKLGQYSAAIEDYNKAISLRQTDPEEYYASRGLMYSYLGQHKKALDDENKAIALDPADGESYERRGFTYMMMRDYKRALEDYHKFGELFLDSERTDIKALLHLRQGQIAYYTNDYKQAVDELNLALDNDPKCALAYHYRGKVYEKIGQKDLANKDEALAKQISYTLAPGEP